jgi:hypothetical protein
LIPVVDNVPLVNIVYWLPLRGGAGGRDVERTRFAAAIVLGLSSLQAMGQAAGDLHSDFKTSFAGSPLTCSQPEKLTIPKSIAKRARLKADLLDLLRESIYDDSKGIVNPAREKEIANIADRLKKERAW